MIFDWYSGSDLSAQVPKGIRELSLVPEEGQKKPCIDEFQKLLDLERDRNWRGYLLYYLAHQHHLAGDEERAKDTLHRALDEFDLFARNFRDVEVQYANTLYHLAKAVYWETDDTDSVVEYALRILPYQDCLRNSREGKELFEILDMVGEALFSKATENEDKSLYRIALDFFLRAHQIDPDNPNTLARIAYSHYGAGNDDEAKTAFAAYERLEEETGLRYQHAEHLREFMYSAYPDLLDKTIKSYRSESLDEPGGIS